MDYQIPLYLSGIEKPRFWKEHQEDAHVRWFVPDNNDPTEIYYYQPHNLSGSTRTIRFENALPKQYKGIWNSNPNSLLSTMGIDLFPYHRQKVFISKDTRYIGGQLFASNIIFEDKEIVTDHLDRGDLIVRKMIRENPSNTLWLVKVGAKGRQSSCWNYENAFRAGYDDDKEALDYLRGRLLNALPVKAKNELEHVWDKFPFNDVVFIENKSRQQINLIGAFAQTMDVDTLHWAHIKGFIRKELEALDHVGEMRIASLSCGEFMRMEHELERGIYSRVYGNVHWDRNALRSMNAWFSKNKHKSRLD